MLILSQGIPEPNIKIGLSPALSFIDPSLGLNDSVFTFTMKKIVGLAFAALWLMVGCSSNTIAGAYLITSSPDGEFDNDTLHVHLQSNSITIVMSDGDALRFQQQGKNEYDAIDEHGVYTATFYQNTLTISMDTKRGKLYMYCKKL